MQIEYGYGFTLIVNEKETKKGFLWNIGQLVGAYYNIEDGEGYRILRKTYLAKC